MKSFAQISLAALVVTLPMVALTASNSSAATGKCDVSPNSGGSGSGNYTDYTGTDPLSDKSPVATTPGLSEAQCFATIEKLGTVVEDIFRDAKGRTGFELPAYGTLFNMYPGETSPGICEGFTAKAGSAAGATRNAVGVYSCASNPSNAYTFAMQSQYTNALDWKWTQMDRYDPSGRKWCADPTQGCFGGRCYDNSCVQVDGTLQACAAGQICKAGACVAGDPSTLPTCTPLNAKPYIGDGNTSFYNPWDGLVFDLGGFANKVAIFPNTDHGPLPCEANEYTVYLTNNPYSREVVDDPAKTGADPNKWNRAKLFKIYTHGFIDKPDCYDAPDTACTCTGAGCTLPAKTDPPNFEADAMVPIFTLPCGIRFRYVGAISGYDGKSLGDPSAGPDLCEYDSADDELDAIAGLNDDESAICPDQDGDGFPTCDCAPAGSLCDCVDDPAKDPDAPKYHPGAAQACDGPQYSCTPTVCPTGTVCAVHQCLSACAPGEFKCAPGFSCQDQAVADAGTTQQVCVPAACGDAGVCAPGELCQAGKCIDPCAAPTKCPAGQVCQDGKCKDPCALLKCPTGQICNAGQCEDNCACIAQSSTAYPCSGPTPACNTTSGTCVPAGCDTTTCPAGQHCELVGTTPTCKNECDGVVCPPGSTCDPVKGCGTACDLRATPCPDGTVCNNGDCVEPACANVTCTAPATCVGGQCTAGGGDFCLGCDTGAEDTGIATDGSVGDASVGDGSNGNGDGDTGSKSGCGCRTTSSGGEGAGLALGALALAIVIARRRRR